MIIRNRWANNPIRVKNPDNLSDAEIGLMHKLACAIANVLIVPYDDIMREWEISEGDTWYRADLSGRRLRII